MYYKNMKSKYLIGGIILVLVVIALVGFLVWQQNRPSQYDTLAQCLKDKGVVFYGAFWCPHCQSQKSFFGSSARLLPYVECSTPDGQGQTQVCIDQKITGYPTWVFPDHHRETGEQTIAHLTEKSGCNLPK